MTIGRVGRVVVPSPSATWIINPVYMRHRGGIWLAWKFPTGSGCGEKFQRGKRGL